MRGKARMAKNKEIWEGTKRQFGLRAEQSYLGSVPFKALHLNAFGDSVSLEMPN